MVAAFEVHLKTLKIVYDDKTNRLAPLLGGGGAKSIRRRESLVICKSFNALWKGQSNSAKRPCWDCTMCTYVCAVYSVFRKCLTASNPTTMLRISILHHKNRYIGSINLKPPMIKGDWEQPRGAFEHWIMIQFNSNHNTGSADVNFETV